MRSIREWVSIKAIKSPRLVILLFVLIGNAAFIAISALVISLITEPALESGGYLSSLLNTVIMYLGIGGIDTVIEDISQANVILTLSCVVIIIIGLIFFAFALIGYMSELISSLIGDADSNSKKLRISNHIVILNWNSRAVEIINDLLYKNTRERIVILAANDREEVQKDIDERLTETVETENDSIREACAVMGVNERRSYIRKNKIKNRLTIITREGNTCSTMQLGDIAIKQAKSVIILSDGSNEVSVDSHTIKTLIQVAEMTASEDSADDQQIVVEVEDEQTLVLIEKIIKYKMRNGKCNIVPISVNRILGYIFSQFTIMPELNEVYSTLFSYRGADFFALPAETSHKGGAHAGTSSAGAPSIGTTPAGAIPAEASRTRAAPAGGSHTRASHVGKTPPSDNLSDLQFVSEFLERNQKAVPLTVMKADDGESYCYYVAESEQDIRNAGAVTYDSDFVVSLNPDYEMEGRHVIILGHSSKNLSMMEGFAAFNGEWRKKDGSGVLDVTIIDDESSLLQQDNYKQYPWVKKIISAEIHEQEIICNAINEFIDTHDQNVCIMILSDDTASGEDVDENALTYLVLVQDIIISRLENDSKFDLTGIDIIVEIVDPKNHDIVNNYNTKNVVISNRYISKMIMQVGENKALYDFYQDFLTYDEFDTTGIGSDTMKVSIDSGEGIPGDAAVSSNKLSGNSGVTAVNNSTFEAITGEVVASSVMTDAVIAGSKEIYIRRADAFFNEIPKPCTAAGLIRAVYHCSPDDNKCVLLGYFHADGEMILFSGDQSNIHVSLSGAEKLIIFSDH